MPYNSALTRTGAAALIPEDVAREIVQGVAESSLIMRLATRGADMPRAQRRMPVLASLPIAYFVDGDTGLKQSSDVTWENKYLDAEEIAVIVPIPEAVLDDADYDIWSEVRPRIVEAVGVTFDAAVLHGTNAPTSWPDDIVTAATAAGNTTDLSAAVDIYEAVMGENGVIAEVEEDGFMVNGHLAHLTMRSKLRGLRNTDGLPIFNATMQEGTRYQLDGEPMEFARNGGVDSSALLMVSGDWSQLVYAMRQDITFKILDQAVIQDGSGNIVHNLAQQDMIALRAVMRVAWQVPNPLNRVNSDSTTRYPFSILIP